MTSNPGSNWTSPSSMSTSSLSFSKFRAAASPSITRRNSVNATSMVGGGLRRHSGLSRLLGRLQTIEGAGTCPRRQSALRGVSVPRRLVDHRTGTSLPYAMVPRPSSSYGHTTSFQHHKQLQKQQPLQAQSLTITKSSDNGNERSPSVVRNLEEGISMSNTSNGSVRKLERINMSGRGLEECPILEKDPQVRLLNYENNKITRLSNFDGLSHLIFLDLYNNRVERIEGLDSVPTLRVLMLGKNRIKRMENLHMLKRLDVLDLHGNQIEEISNLDALVELRVLNLAGNLITEVQGLSCLAALTELNLRRNQIRSLHNLNSLISLTRLFLSSNALADVNVLESVLCLPSIAELTLDGNPFAQSSAYRQIVLGRLPALRVLDLRRVSLEERRIALAVHMSMKYQRQEQHDEQRVMQQTQSHVSYNQANDDRTQLLLKNNQRHLVENNHSQFKSRREISNVIVDRDIAIAKVRKSWDLRMKSRNENDEDMRRFESYVELSPRNTTFALFGSCLDQFAVNRWQNVRVISFSFMDFNKISQYFTYFREVPSLHSLAFVDNDLHSFYQLDTLSVFANLCELIIRENPICSIPQYQSYVIFRVPPLKTFNDVELTVNDRIGSKRLYEELKNRWKTPGIRRTRGFTTPVVHLKSSVVKSCSSSSLNPIEKSPDWMICHEKSRDAIVIDYSKQQRAQFSQTYVQATKNQAIRSLQHFHLIDSAWDSVALEIVLQSVCE